MPTPAESPNPEWPTDPRALVDLAGHFARQRKFDLEKEAWRRAAAAMPSNAEIRHNHGLAIFREKNWAQALPEFEAAVAIKPDFAEAHYQVGVCRHWMKQPDLAVISLRKAIQLRREFPEAQLALGAALDYLGKDFEAIECYDRALKANPGLTDIHYNLGVHHCKRGRTRTGVEHLKKYVALRPDDFDARRSLGMYLLRIGEYPQGWELFEARHLTMAEPYPIGLTESDKLRPEHMNESIGGKSILVWSEEGMGDAIAFSRFLTDLAERGALITFAAPPPLADLLATVPGVQRVIVAGHEMPHYDYHSSVISLPYLLGAGEAMIRRTGPYLSVAPERLESWRQLVEKEIQPGQVRKKIGLAWAGNPLYGHDHIRSPGFTAIRDLAKAKNIHWINLQMPPGLTQYDPAAGFNLVNLSENVKNFADTAALMMQLDLIITSDTSIAHLAGALGKPTWVMLANVADWRWLEGRDDSPWYEKMKLFRQKSAGDWGSVVKKILRETQP